MTHGSAKRKVQCTALLAAGLSSALELGVIALVFPSCFKSGECIEKTFCCNNTQRCAAGLSSNGCWAEKERAGEHW